MSKLELTRDLQCVVLPMRPEAAMQEILYWQGDILFLHMSKDPIRAGEIVVFNMDGRHIPIVHRVIKVHERRDSREEYILTKGDNNPKDDRMLYAPGQRWLQKHHIMGRAAGFLPYVGWVTIIMTEKPIIKNLCSSDKGYNSFPTNLPGTACHKALLARKRLSQILKQIVSERKQKKVLQKDLLGDMLNFQNEKGQNLSGDEISDNIIGVLFAAQDTTASVLTWVLKYLHDNQNILEAEYFHVS